MAEAAAAAAEVPPAELHNAAAASTAAARMLRCAMSICQLLPLALCQDDLSSWPARARLQRLPACQGKRLSHQTFLQDAAAGTSRLDTMALLLRRRLPTMPARLRLPRQRCTSAAPCPAVTARSRCSGQTALLAARAARQGERQLCGAAVAAAHSSAKLGAVVHRQRHLEGRVAAPAGAAGDSGGRTAAPRGPQTGGASEATRCVTALLRYGDVPDRSA